MKKGDKRKKIKKPRGVERPKRSQNGIRVFLKEVDRVSYTSGIACFCTPGHNRGAGF